MSPSSRTLATSVLLAVIATGDCTAERMELAVGARVRTYALERSAAEGPRPTIIMLHGFTGSGELVAKQSGLVEPAKRAGMVAVFPDGPGGRWNFLPQKHQTSTFALLFQASGGLPDDVAFLNLLVNDLVKRGISDPKRIYLAGRSLGGAMTLQMACAETELFAAIAIMISSMPDETGESCRPTRPLPALVMNVTADPMVPYGGGRIGQGGLPSGVTNVWSTERLLAFFRSLNGCSDAAERSVSSGQEPAIPAADVLRWVKCAGGPVILRRIAGKEHAIPPTLNPGQFLVDFFRDKSR